MHQSISIPAAAELCAVGEPAIRRALRDGRISLAFQWVVGGGGTINYLNLASVIRCYGADRDVALSLIEKWSCYAPVIRSLDGRDWTILDRAEPMILLEPPEHADGGDT